MRRFPILRWKKIWVFERHNLDIPSQICLDCGREAQEIAMYHLPCVQIERGRAPTAFECLVQFLSGIWVAVFFLIWFFALVG